MRKENKDIILGKIRLASFMIGYNYTATIDDGIAYVIYYIKGVRFCLEMPVIEVDKLDFVELYCDFEKKLQKALNRYRADCVRYGK